MRLHYFTETRELMSGRNIDLNAKGEVVGFDISRQLDLTTVNTEGLPTRKRRAS